MKILSILGVMLLTVATAGCGDDDTPAAPRAINYDGSYQVSSVLNSNSCSISLPTPPTQIAVDVDGDEATIGGIDCTFNESTKRAVGSWPPDCYDLGGGCTGCTIGGLNVVFTDSKHFEGTFYVEYDFHSGCSATDCAAQWTISGAKVATSSVSIDTIEWAIVYGKILEQCRFE